MYKVFVLLKMVHLAIYFIEQCMNLYVVYCAELMVGSWCYTCVQRQGWTCGHEIPGTQEDSWRQRASPRYTNGLEDRGLGVQDDPWVQRTSSRYPNGLKDRGLVRGWRVGLGNPSLEKADILVAL